MKNMYLLHVRFTKNGKLYSYRYESDSDFIRLDDVLEFGEYPVHTPTGTGYLIKIVKRDNNLDWIKRYKNAYLSESTFKRLMRDSTVDDCHNTTVNKKDDNTMNIADLEKEVSRLESQVNDMNQSIIRKRFEIVSAKAHKLINLNNQINSLKEAKENVTDENTRNEIDKLIDDMQMLFKKL